MLKPVAPEVGLLTVNASGVPGVCATGEIKSKYTHPPLAGKFAFNKFVVPTTSFRPDAPEVKVYIVTVVSAPDPPLVIYKLKPSKYPLIAGVNV